MQHKIIADAAESARPRIDPVTSIIPPSRKNGPSAGDKKFPIVPSPSHDPPPGGNKLFPDVPKSSLPTQNCETKPPPQPSPVLQGRDTATPARSPTPSSPPHASSPGAFASVALPLTSASC